MTFSPVISCSSQRLCPPLVGAGHVIRLGSVTVATGPLGRESHPSFPWEIPMWDTNVDKVPEQSTTTTKHPDNCTYLPAWTFQMNSFGSFSTSKFPRDHSQFTQNYKKCLVCSSPSSLQHAHKRSMRLTRVTGFWNFKDVYFKKTPKECKCCTISHLKVLKGVIVCIVLVLDKT